MPLLFSADLHFGHRAIIEHSRRPFDTVEEMNEVLIENWNRTVKSNDEVWFLGDIEFISGHSAIYWLEKLNGHIHVCLGNHDKKKDVLRSRAVSVQDVKYLRYGKRKFHLSHYCHRVWRNSNHGVFHLFGHSHGDIVVRSGRLMDVGVDAVAKHLAVPTQPSDYRPISYDEVVGHLEDQEITDHHMTRVVM